MTAMVIISNKNDSLHFTRAIQLLSKCCRGHFDFRKVTLGAGYLLLPPVFQLRVALLPRDLDSQARFALSPQFCCASGWSGS